MPDGRDKPYARPQLIRVFGGRESEAMLLTLFLSGTLAAAPVLPKYDDYPSEESSQGPPAAPELTSHPRAPHYRTVLRSRAASGPNFAGHYTLLTIGAGTGAVEIVVLDAATGQVFFPRGLPLVQWAGWWHEPYRAQYRRSSRLLVVYGWGGKPGSLQSADGPYGVSYFVWDGRDFTRIAFVSRDRGNAP
jgi:hypothetical protein